MKRTLAIIVATTLAAFLISGSVVNAQPSVIITQQESPLQITKVGAKAERDGYSTDLIVAAEYRNISDRQILAVKICFRTYDLFREIDGGICGVARENMTPSGRNQNARGRWDARARIPNLHETVVAFVSKVRFQDEVWEADMESVEDHLRAALPWADGDLDEILNPSP